MRIITEKDRRGAAKALQVFISHVSGQRKTPLKVLLDAVDQAIDHGLTLDELLNKGNYTRVLTATNSRTDVFAYVDLMAQNIVSVRKLTEEEGWNEPESFGVIAEAFHSFFKEIQPKGGVWNTPNARLKLTTAISRHGIQALASEKLILEAAELSADKGEMTCFNYIDCIVNSTIKVEETFTEAEMKRQAEIAGEINRTLITEGNEPENDDSIFDEFDNEDPYFNPDFGNMDEDADNSFVAYKDPREYKRGCVTGLVFGLTMKELNAIKDAIEDDCEAETLEDVISALTDGHIDRNKESHDARQAHQYLRMELIASFINCVQLQGIEISDENASEYDVLLCNWDMRDAEARKLQKLKQLIYDYGDKDDDLTNAIKDLEKLYQKN